MTSRSLRGLFANRTLAACGQHGVGIPSAARGLYGAALL